jgi:hypothetical protein
MTVIQNRQPFCLAINSAFCKVKSLTYSFFDFKIDIFLFYVKITSQFQFKIRKIQCVNF